MYVYLEEALIEGVCVQRRPLLKVYVYLEEALIEGVRVPRGGPY